MYLFKNSWNITIHNTCLKRFQHRHFIDKVFIHFTFLVRGLEENAPEGLSVHGPECADCESFDGGCSRHVVQQGQFSESTAIIISMNMTVYSCGIFHVNLKFPSETYNTTIKDDWK